MRLIVGLMGGRQVDIDVSGPDLVCQVADRAARTLQLPERLSLITEAGVRLNPSRTVEQLRLLEEQRLTGVVVPDIPSAVVEVDLEVKGQADKGALRMLLAQGVQGDQPYVAKLCGSSSRETQQHLEALPWSELANAQALAVGWVLVGEGEVKALMQGLCQLNGLRRLQLEVRGVPYGSLLPLLEAVPECMEELDITCDGASAEAVTASLPRLTCLREVRLKRLGEWQFLESVWGALPPCVETVQLGLSGDVAGIAAHLLRKPALKVVCLRGCYASAAGLVRFLNALPAELQGLDLGNCCSIGFIDDDIALQLQRSMRRLAHLRSFTAWLCWPATAALLSIVPEGLEELACLVRSGPEVLEVLEAVLQRASKLRSLIVNHPLMGASHVTAILRAVADPQQLETLGFLGPLFLEVAEAVAEQLPRFVRLKALSFSTLYTEAFLAVMTALPSTVQEIRLESFEDESVLALKGRLGPAQLSQLRAAKVSSREEPGAAARFQRLLN